MSTEKTASNANNKAPETAVKTPAAAPASDKSAANTAPAASAKAESAPAAKAAKKAVKKTVRKARKTATNNTAGRKSGAEKSAKRAVSKTARTATRAAATGKQTAQTVTKTINKQSTRMESMVTQGKTQFDNLTQDAAKTGKDQVDAFMQAGNLFMKGFEDIAKTYMSMAQTSAEKNSQAVKSILGCKTINEFTEAQNKWAQQNFDDFMTGTTKLSELSVKVATDALEPINDQVSKSIKKASESIAA